MSEEKMNRMEEKKSVLLSEEIADRIWEIFRASRNASHPVGSGEVTAEQYWILRLLYNNGSQRIKDIAAHIGTTPSPVTISVKRLERQNLVKRERRTKDERVVDVHLTNPGKDRFEQWRERRRKVLSGMFDPLTSQEKRTLVGLLQKVAPNEKTVIER